MIILALILLLIVAVVVVLMVAAGRSDAIHVEIPYVDISWEATPLALFLLGAVTLILAVVALGLIRAGSRRKMAQRREIKELRKQARSTPSQPANIPPRPVESTPPTTSTDVRDPLYVDRDR